VTNKESIANGLRFLFCNFPSISGDVQPDLVIHALWHPRNCEGGWIAAPGISLTVRYEGQIVPYVRNVVEHFILSRCQEWIALHGAAVSYEGRAMVILGAGGSGKSTLCAEMVRRGWWFLSDDFVPLRVDTREVWPFPVPIELRQDSKGAMPAWAAHANMHNPILGSWNEERKWPVDPSSVPWGGIGQPATLGCLAMLESGFQDVPSVRLMTSDVSRFLPIAHIFGGTATRYANAHKISRILGGGVAAASVCVGRPVATATALGEFCQKYGGAWGK